MIDKTRLAKLLGGLRGRAAVDRAALVSLVQRFSELMLLLRDQVAEVDLNPVIVSQSGCSIVDALVIPAQRATGMWALSALMITDSKMPTAGTLTAM